MSDFCSIRAKIISVDRNAGPMPAILMNRLTEFTQQHYDISNVAVFVEDILRPQQSGSILAFYSESDELAGYSRVYRHRFTVKGKPVCVYSAKTYHNQSHNLNAASARLGLTEMMKYKLTHPEEELIYLSSIDSPCNYEFLAKLTNCLYPQPSIQIPEYILELVKMMKEKNNWASCPTHPMLISGQLRQRHYKPLASVHADDSLIDYYLSLNPGYAEGCALLAYIPLNLGNIAYGIRQLVTHTTQSNHVLTQANRSLTLSA